MQTYLDFEKGLAELQGKAEELRAMARQDPGMETGTEADQLDHKADEMLRGLYSELTPWQKCQVARHPNRPHAGDYIEALFSEYTPLAGDRNFADDSAVMGGLARLADRPVMVIGHEKGSDTKSRLERNFGMARPEGYRKAVRLMELADRFGLPLITLVDTPGAYPGKGAEERGQAEAIARSTDMCLRLHAPLISVVIGEGGSGGAVAFATANRVIGCARDVLTQIEQERPLQREPVSTVPRIEAQDRESVQRSPAPTARSDLEAVVNAATALYQDQIKDPIGKEAVGYLRGRGFDMETIDRWKLGYAPDSWEALTTALREQGFSDDQLLEAGVAGRSRYGRLYDRMRNRVIFPIHGEDGVTRGFAGRLLTGDGPKYLNTPETEMYQKRTLLYGMHLARQPIIEAGNAVIVEGYTDAIAAHQAGVTNVVATAGTSLTSEHLDTLAQTTKSITLAFDGDEAGLLAVERTANLDRSQHGLRLFVARLPEGQDPAGLLIDPETQALENVIAQAVPIEHHLIDQILLRHNLEEPEAITRAIRDSRPVLRCTPDTDARAEATAYLAKRLGRDVALVAEYLQETSQPRAHEQSRSNGWSIA